MKNQLVYIFIEDPAVATFYMLTKVHKNAAHPPRHPIVSGDNNFGQLVFRVIDYFLQSLLAAIFKRYNRYATKDGWKRTGGRQDTGNL